MAILFYAKNTSYKISGKRKIKNWIKKVIDINKKETGEIIIIITNDEDLLELNRKFLGRNYYTDILAFDYSKKDKISGELYISIERIIENAREFKISVEEELYRVIIHGILHLLGFRDKKKHEKAEIRKFEEEYLKLIY